MKNFQQVVNSNTISAWVNAFNNNALASSDHTFYLGEILFSSVLYTGNETVGKQKIALYKDLSEKFINIFPTDLVIDNWYIYFRNINKIIYLDNLHLDLTDPTKYENYTVGDLYHVFINSDLGYRVSHSPMCRGNEARIFRFVANAERFTQCMATFPRFGYFGSNAEFHDVLGLDVKPVPALSLGLNNGIIDYNGIDYENHVLPDKLICEADKISGPIIYDGGRGFKEGDILKVDGIFLDVTGVERDMAYYIEYDPGTSYMMHTQVMDSTLETYYSLIDNNDRPLSDISAWSPMGLAGVIRSCIIIPDGVVSSTGTGQIIKIEATFAPHNLIYSGSDKRIIYTPLVQQSVDSTRWVDYETSVTNMVPFGKYTIQRIMYDYYKKTLILQYGNMVFDTLEAASQSIYSVEYPFPYNTYIFPVLAFMVIKSGCTDITDTKQAKIYQIRTRTSDIRNTELLATDDYARGRINDLLQMIINLQQQVNVIKADLEETKKRLAGHISDYNNPHRTTPWNLVEGFDKNSWMDPNTGKAWKVEDLPLREGSPTKTYIDGLYQDILLRINNLDGRFVKKAGDTMSGRLTIQVPTGGVWDGIGLDVQASVHLGQSSATGANGYGIVNIRPDYIRCRGIEFYVGSLPGTATTGSYGIKQ